ncbi:phosphoenolpyruvate carboxykinase (ATP) [Elizabethkingia anophelis]|uniref:phosphoenolpyruvate carboxykinase (ATP) n=1 Tax=Elizabethkingia anophelis TaxID=1117645 RepID=UPI001629A770|nr:phosphoenolpyruvate carboxykinase (ATP) [Elizabethkingia anophelis]MCT4323816.1 phosphoenolpyruvate carboxykinase (ATP) [Elizabethkingia anophelis]HAY3536603.1 phosphoenolpyruvate carboxykinase (ATP) [Elizabethkingia anophelis]HAY3548719.1 phosphoenolpyruvate carboxykinase (ATP) [Elizabethkingia anophelis]HAY3592484.1 phosphoenolpyruvate carboxykinase (ATP) [Elizabethkingia anophelis]
MRSLEKFGIKNDNVKWQLSPEELVQETVSLKHGFVAKSGALAINTGEFTGRSPKDRFIVKDEVTADRVWWDGKVNLPFDSEKFDALYNRVAEYASDIPLYAREAFAVADKRYQVKITAVTEFPWSNQFVYNMFIRPTVDELESFGETDWLILCIPSFKADPERDGTRQHNFSILNFKRKIALIGGSAYTGEMKKGIFSALNFTLPVQQNVLPMHCSANAGADGETAIFFGLSGTGKTTLSADPNRKLIGDDEHGWTPDNTVFNIEGGCYAKAIDLSAEKEPDIYGAIKPGAILENVFFDENGEADYTKDSITPNTRVSYPIDFINNIQVPSIGKNPKNIFFLTFDAFGVLPPISRLTPEQAAYHFISGYTSKVAGTEVGVTEPQTTFSVCFGAAFMPLHPTEYGKMLSEKIKGADAKVWLVNTGFNGKMKRMSLKDTRALISAALDGKLNDVDYKESPIFKVQIPVSCEGVSDESMLLPENSWDSYDAYIEKARSLALAFHKNFERFDDIKDESILAGAPRKEAEVI